jgi:ubiquinone/menaquinone biosynthesis C-methylase UbiE
MQKLFFFFQYLSKPRWDTGITPPELESFATNHSPGRALDLGCGTGTNAVFLAKNGWQVTGVDFVERAIRTAKRKASQAGVKVKFICGDVTQLDITPGGFDLILDIGCLHSLPPDKKKMYMKNVARLLSQQGTYMLYAFIKDCSVDGRGLDQHDLERLADHLELIEKLEGSERGRASTWFYWRKSIDPAPVQ